MEKEILPRHARDTKRRKTERQDNMLLVAITGGYSSQAYQFRSEWLTIGRSPSSASALRDALSTRGGNGEKEAEAAAAAAAAAAGGGGKKRCRHDTRLAYTYLHLH